MVRKKVFAVSEGDIPLRTDAELLKNHFQMRTVRGFKPGLIRKKLIHVVPIVVRLFKGTLWADVTYTYFADVDAFLVVLFSMMLGKKSVVVASGHSVADMPSIDFGSMSRRIPSHVVKFILRHATRVLAVSEFNMKEILRYVPSDKVRLILRSVDSAKFKPGDEKQGNLVLTVGNVTKNNLARKGLETFVKAARFLPEADFVLIGRNVDNSIHYLERSATPNVRFTGYVALDDLIAYYQRAKVYVQVSAHEAFGVSLGEAMLCECVPVVTNTTALPEVVGDTGFYVPYADPEATAEAIGRALDSGKGKEARERIRRMFPPGKRERELTMEIQGLLEA